MPVPTGFATTKRARDEDRASACASLDLGLADGQLTSAEHEARINAAMNARSLGELHTLIRDIQGASPMATQRGNTGGHQFTKPTKTQPHRLKFLQIVIPALVTLLMVFLLIRLSGGTDESGAAGGQPDLPKTGYLSQQGLHEVIDAVRDRFGTTMVDDLTAYQHYIVVFLPDPSVPRKQVTYRYDGEWNDPSNSGTRDPKVPMIDLAAMNVDRMAGILAGAGQSLNLGSDIETIYLVARAEEDGPDMSIHATNEQQESGFLTVDMAGNFVSVHRFDPEK